MSGPGSKERCSVSLVHLLKIEENKNEEKRIQEKIELASRHFPLCRFPVGCVMSIGACVEVLTGLAALATMSYFIWSQPIQVYASLPLQMREPKLREIERLPK